MYIVSMNLEDRIISFYRHFNHVVRGVSLDYEVTDAERDCVSKFVVMVCSDVPVGSIGDDWLFHYFCFQFSYWDGLDTGYSDRIQMTWILGKKAYERWRERRDDYRFLNQCWARERGIHPPPSSSDERSYEDLKDIEDVERGRFHNEPEGLVHCITTTTMYDQESEWCRSCVHSDDCVRVLRREHPRIYRNRGYARRKHIEF